MRQGGSWLVLVTWLAIVFVCGLALTMAFRMIDW